MINNNSLSFQTIVLFISKAVASLAMFTILIILSRYFSKEEYGTFQLYWYMVAIFIPLFFMGLPNSINYFGVTDDHSKRNNYVYHTLFAGLLLSLLIVMSFKLFESSILFFLNNNQIESLYVFILISVVAMMMNSFYQPIFIILKQTKLLVYTSFIFSVFIIASVLLPIIYSYSLFSVIKFLSCNLY